MPHRRNEPPAHYELFLEPEVHEVRARLPGHVRQRVKRAIDDLAHAPRPADSRDWVWVLAIHRRPPYDYEDLADIAARVR